MNNTFTSKTISLKEKAEQLAMTAAILAVVGKAALLNTINKKKGN